MLSQVGGRQRHKVGPLRFRQDNTTVKSRYLQAAVYSLIVLVLNLFEIGLAASVRRGHVLAFKALMAGAIGAASTSSGNATAKGLSSGSYTIWRDDAAGVGASQTSVTAATLQDCLTACDVSDTCAGVAMVTDGSTDATAALSTGGCSLIKGDRTVGTFKRSMTRVVTSRLTTAIIGAGVCAGRGGPCCSCAGCAWLMHRRAQT